jgi:hypothetical protein
MGESHFDQHRAENLSLLSDAAPSPKAAQSLHYQPVDLRRGQIVGVRRWCAGCIGTGDRRVHPLAERTG